MTVKPLLPGQTVTMKGDAPSRDLVEVIQRIVQDTLALNAVESDNIANAPGGAPRFFARAWVSFAGATGVIADSGNVTSVTRSSAGSYTVNFTDAAPNGSYAPMALSDGGTVFFAFGTRNTGSCVINTRNSGGVLFDPNAVTVAFIW